MPKLFSPLALGRLRERPQSWRWMLPVFLLLLFLFALLWLPWQAQRMEATEREEQLIADTLWVEQTIRFQLSRDEESLTLAAADIAAGTLDTRKWEFRMNALLRNSREIIRVGWLDANGRQVESTDGRTITEAELPPASRAALEHAREIRAPRYSAPVWSDGAATFDYHMPIFAGGRYLGDLVATYNASNILDQMVPWWFARDNEIRLTDFEDRLLDRRAAGGAGRNVYTHNHALELPGLTLMLHTNSVKSAPKLLPNLLVGSVIALSLGLLWSLAALWRDIVRRQAAEDALREQLLFRSAMENSLVTGLRARDLDGRVTYVNPAFCQMVGYPAHEIVGRVPPMPYWAPEAMNEYQQRFSQVLAGTITPHFETIFQRADGERFPVMVFEAPLLDEHGQQTGWMSSILDISELRRAENINRQQQEQLQASARLASMGEIASTLAHELNQPLAAISSYTAGALNMLARPDADRMPPGMLRGALEKTHAQAQRAGNIIRSVHAFAKKRDPARHPVDVTRLLHGLLPLVETQARDAMVRIRLSCAPDLPPVLGDKVMLEQVLLNLTRNGIEAMRDTAPEQRLMTISAALATGTASPMLQISVGDHGHGIAEDVAGKLFSAFFSTKSEGMGVGLNICRSVVEAHGGTLTHRPDPDGGTQFCFTLPALASEATPTAPTPPVEPKPAPEREDSQA
ncbi:sensor histidine kinase [Noviherbaspirillum pedocola]|uniref:histidine kinase n=1 Tax=Noviherbaspirillum pedocola TaxID=2801341 RepID=A0A934VZV1_9BURK|nr:PAS domain S-box protein [Noviherbaspirillum pedocola]MBK4733421.1 PAS domain S-box protein [Noviherbaspirillum pedocola]